MSLRVLLVFCLLLFGCTSTPTVPPRPSSVPNTAFWSGGLDGGYWYDCQLKDAFNLCSIYSQEGKLFIRAKYQLEKEGRAATALELKNPAIDHIPDATVIYLESVQKLIAKEVLYLDKS